MIVVAGGAVTGHGSKFGRSKEQALAALLVHRNVEEAARSIGLSPQTLYRWLKIPAFEARYREGVEAIFVQALARLQQATVAAATVLLRVLHDSSASPAARLKAADRILSRTRVTGRMAEVGARLRALNSPPDTAGPNERGRVRKAGHGARSDRKRDEAIVALLTQRSVEEAARVAGIGTATLYRWMKDPEFAAAYRAARLAAFGQADARLRKASEPAVTTILKIMVNPNAPAAIQVRAADLVLKHATDASEEDIEACMAVRRARQAAAGIRRWEDGVHSRERPRVAA